MSKINKQIFSLNKVWHLANKMPKNPTLKQRIKWHTEHAKNCNCWPIPSKLLEEIKKKDVR